MRYKQGDLEQAIKNLILDIFERSFQTETEEEEQPEEEQSRVHVRGVVRHPESDKRLKKNRAA